MSDEAKKPEGEEVIDKPAEEVTEDAKPVGAKEFKDIVDGAVKQFSDTLDRRQKNFDMSGTDEDKKALDEANKYKSTIKFLNAFANEEKSVVREMHEKNPLFPKMKALNETTGSAGGFLVPIEFERSINKYVEQYDQIRRVSTVLAMGTSTMRLNALSGEPTAYIVGEGVGITGSAMTFAEPILTAKKYAAIVDWTSEVEEDAELNLIDLVAERIGRQIAKTEQTEFLTGATAGSEGMLVVTGVTNVNLRKDATFTGTTFSDITWDDLANMHAALQAIDLVDAEDSVYMMSPTVFNVLRKAKASTSGEYFVLPAPQDGVVAKAWGHDVVLNNQMPQVSATATGTKFVLLSNFKKHAFIGDRRGITVKISTEGYVGGQSLFERDNAALRVTKRTAFVTSLNNGIVALSTN